MEQSIKDRAADVRKFNRFYTNIVGLVNQTILESPYSLAEVRVLLEIDAANQCTASNLSEILQIDRGYLSRILRRFEKEGLIVTTPSAADRRSRILAITEKGKAVFRQLSDASSVQIIQLLDHLPQGGQQQLVTHMTAIECLLSGKPDTPITIRTRQPGDAGYIAYRHGALYALEYGFDHVFEKYVLQSLSKYMEDPTKGEIWVAECCGSVAGFIGLVEIDETTAQLRWFLIEPEFRGVGLGRRLVQTLLNHCRKKGYRHIFLWTFKGLDAALHLYKEVGFTLTEEKENHEWKDQLTEQRWDVELGKNDWFLRKFG